MTQGASGRPLAVVVGAGGMGMAVAQHLAATYRVLLADIDLARASEGAERIAAAGGEAIGVRCDVTDKESAESLAVDVEQLGGFRAFVHVAGLSPSMGDFSTIIRVNLAGVAHVAEALVPQASAGTAAVLISSLAAHGANPPDPLAAMLNDPGNPLLVEKLRTELGEGRDTPEAAYQLSKWGVNSYARNNVRNWARQGARIMSLSPGLIATPMGALELEARPSKRRLLEQSPMGREGTMEEIAAAVEFLVSDQASFISGIDLLVDGGLAAAMTAQDER